jgi:hypothetical protein
MKTRLINLLISERIRTTPFEAFDWNLESGKLAQSLGIESTKTVKDAALDAENLFSKILILVNDKRYKDGDVSDSSMCGWNVGLILAEAKTIQSALSYGNLNAVIKTLIYQIHLR